MVQEWDYKTILAFGQEDNPLLLKKPRVWTIKEEEYCPYCNNPKSLIKGIGKIKKNMIKRIDSIRFHLDHLKKNNLNKFDISTLKKSMNIIHLSDGTLQRKILGILTILGYFKIEIIKIPKKRIKYIYIKNTIKKPSECYDPIGDKHLLNKDVKWIKTKYFDDKHNIDREKEEYQYD